MAELYEQKGEPEQAVRILQRVVQAGVPGEDEARHGGGSIVGPAEYGEDLIIGDRFGGVIGLAGATHRVNPDGQIISGHHLVEGHEVL